MNNKVVFDSSAFIALLAKEPGVEIVKRHLRNGIISSVNVAEVWKYCIDKQGLTTQECKSLIRMSGIKIIDHDANQALISAEIYPKTKEYGLSLGDRSCIALAIDKESSILTCDKIWSKVDLGVEFLMAR